MENWYDYKKTVTYYWNVYITTTSQLWELPESEIEEVGLFENIPENLTYPANQIEIFIKSKEFGNKNKMLLKHLIFVFRMKFSY